MSELNSQYISKYLSSVPEFNGKTSRLNPAVQLHLTDPSITATELSQTMGISIASTKDLYRDMQKDPTVQAIVASPFYPRRLMTLFAHATVADWVQDPEYAERLLRGEPTMSRFLELHATRGSCDYTCSMCLWSDKQQLTYEKQDLKNFGLLSNQNWEILLKQAYEMGTRTAIFSGGGEPLLKDDLFDLVRAAREIGLKTQLYTNGFGLNRLSESDWEELLQMEQVRISMHSPTEDIYNQIVEMPTKADALPKVSENIKELLTRRNGVKDMARVGIGFVTQDLNFHQIEEMADFAANLGVDFLNIRQDEVAVTRGLTDNEQILVAEQLVRVRKRTINGDYGNTNVDMSDDMTARANGLQQSIRKVEECYMKNMRPAVSPFGIVAPCDLKVEPRFATSATVLGNLRKQPIELIVESMPERKIRANCTECMPSGRTGNAIIAKLVRDFDAGINFSDQPFNSKVS